MSLKRTIFSFVIVSSFCTLIATLIISGFNLQKKIKIAKKSYSILELNVDTIILDKIKIYKNLSFSQKKSKQSLLKLSSNIKDSAFTFIQEHRMACLFLSYYQQDKENISILREYYIEENDTNSKITASSLLAYSLFTPEDITYVKNRLLEFDLQKEKAFSEANKVDSTIKFLNKELEYLNKVRLMLKD
jgi:hypothetical protein